MMSYNKYTEDYINNNVLGQRFGERTITKYCGYKHGEPYFEYFCDCGDVGETSLRTIKTKRCKIKNIIGQRFGKLIVLERTVLKRGHSYLWVCRCDCGKLCICSAFDLTKKRNKDCGECFGSFSEITKRLFSKYKGQAKRRNIIFELSIKDFEKLIYNNCYYCDVSPSNILTYKNIITKYSGIDRINNNLGYIKNNCISCCEQCNVAKSTYTTKEFYDWAKKVVDKYEQSF